MTRWRDDEGSSSSSSPRSQHEDVANTSSTSASSSSNSYNSSSINLLNGPGAKPRMTRSLDADDEQDSSCAEAAPERNEARGRLEIPDMSLSATEKLLECLEKSDESSEEEKKQDRSYDSVNRLDEGKSRRVIEEDDDGTDHAEDASYPPWRPQNVQSTCEFTHTIVDYSQKRESGCKKAEYSGITVDDYGNRWRLIVYVNGNGRASNHHLSLFLQVADADDLPFGWKKAVSYVLTLEHPSGGSFSYAKRNPDKTFKLCPKAIDWGWSQFITSDRIQQEGFVINDSLIVRASVTVKSSSVSIDEEDSELYLKCAVEEGDADAVKLCLDHGASVNCQFKDDLYTPLHTACSSGTNTGSMEVLNLLLEENADCNACNKWRETPLLIAANNGHRTAVQALLKHGANPSLCSEAGWSALTFAAHKGYEDIVSLLLRAGAPVNCPVTEDSSTPLHKACAGGKPGHLKSVQLLIDAGADVHALNKWRETPLLTAANHGQSGAVQSLLAAGADPCKCTDTGWSPLSIAAYKGHDDVVRLLLEEGAPTEEEDPTLSALLQAATKGLPDTVELLLRHGADHTVTTKKGDTALSILVEQNLIDSAVEMVTEYNASISRCSRDRKKVQRARLLISLRMKQMEREGKTALVSTDEEESDDDSPVPNVAQHEEDGDIPKEAVKSMKKKTKQSAEEKAKAAEEALLLELEQEDAKAKKDEAEANSKRAKKKKKKERERQQKQKEEQERREKEEKEAQERDRMKKEKEEQQRKEREMKLKEQRDRELKEMMEREKQLAAKRRDREEREKREKEKKEKEEQHRKDSAVSRESSPLSSSSVKDVVSKPPIKKLAETMPAAAPSMKSSVTTPSTGMSNHQDPSARSRRWEVSSMGKSQLHPSSDSARLDETTTPPPSQQPDRSQVDSTPATVSPSGLLPEERAFTQSHVTKENENAGVLANQVSSVRDGSCLEHPAVALVRRDKLAELVRICAQTLSVVDENLIQLVIYRWTVRAAHSQKPYIDPIVPSWNDHSLLVSFFQRQFISESRKGAGVFVVTQNTESLKEAGASVALFCRNLANDVAQLKRQVPQTWTDSEIQMYASAGVPNGSGPTVTLTWANRAQLHLHSSVFSSLRDRYCGVPARFLSSVFVAKVWYDTQRMLVSNSAIDSHVSPATLSMLSSKAAVSAELWSDPFAALNSNVFWGKFEEVDALFSGQKPFGKDEWGGEEVLAQRGASVVALLPQENIVASRYVQRMVDILDVAGLRGIPVSFSLFIQSDCFPALPNAPSLKDLQMLDHRLCDERAGFVRYVETLPPGKHFFHSGEGYERTSATGSLFALLQNDAGKARFSVGKEDLGGILGSMYSPVLPRSVAPSLIQSDLPPADFRKSERPHKEVPTYFGNIGPISPSPRRTISSCFGAIGRTALGAGTSPSEAPRGARRGRLFDLVDDMEEDQLNDVDIVQGMLKNLDVGLFENNSIGTDVDIEAISLMGIGSPASRTI